MFFSFVLIISLCVGERLDSIQKTGNINLSYLILYCTPIMALWSFVCGSQYNVGTDYFSYYDIFKYGDVALFFNKKEYLFAGIVDVWHQFSLPPQGLFYLFYFICSFLFVLIYNSFRHYSSCFILILLYFTVSNLFNNQLNGLRQSIAVYLITYSTLLFVDGKRKAYFVGVLISSLFHMSSLFGLLLLPFGKIYWTQRRSVTLLIIGLIFSLVAPYNILLSNVSFLVPSQYMHYIGGIFDTSFDFSAIIVKLLFVPFYFESTCFLKNNVNKQLNYLFGIGIISYFIRLITMNNIALNRIGYLFLLLSIIPLLLYWSKLYFSNKKRVVVYCFLCVLLYLLKTILFPKQEYLYNSIFSIL